MAEQGFVPPPMMAISAADALQQINAMVKPPKPPPDEDLMLSLKERRRNQRANVRHIVHRAGLPSSYTEDGQGVFDQDEEDVPAADADDCDEQLNVHTIPPLSGGDEPYSVGDIHMHSDPRDCICCLYAENELPERVIEAMSYLYADTFQKFNELNFMQLACYFAKKCHTTLIPELKHAQQTGKLPRDFHIPFVTTYMIVGCWMMSSAEQLRAKYEEYVLSEFQVELHSEFVRQKKTWKKNPDGERLAPRACLPEMRAFLQITDARHKYAARDLTKSRGFSTMLPHPVVDRYTNPSAGVFGRVPRKETQHDIDHERAAIRNILQPQRRPQGRNRKKNRKRSSASASSASTPASAMSDDDDVDEMVNEDPAFQPPAAKRQKQSAGPTVTAASSLLESMPPCEDSNSAR